MYILDPVPQRWHVDRYDCQTVKQLTSKPTQFYFLTQAPRIGTDDPYTFTLRALVRHLGQVTFGQCIRDLVLEPGGEFAHLIKKEGT
jgi:hypothetical protein